MQKATPFDGILEQCRDLIAKRLSLAIAGMLDKADEALSAYINETQSSEEREICLKARDVTVAQRETIERQFAARYIENFRQCGNRARKIGGTFGDIDYSLGSLRLVSDDDLGETLLFNEMAAKLRAFCDEELMALDQRVGVLLGDADLQVDDNPFSPQLICDAYKHACRRADEDLRVRRILLRLFDDHVLDDIRSVYKAVNALLVQNSILPKIRYGASRKAGQKVPVPGAAAQTPAGAPAPDSSAATAPDLFAMLQKLVASNVGLMAGSGVRGEAGATAAQTGAGSATPVLQGAELMNSLTRIQINDAVALAGGNLAATASVPAAANVLHELKGSSVGAGMGQMDLMTLDIVAMLFDQLFDDPNVPNGVKGIIGRMQIPMLKVAIADKTFFSKKTHPARQLLDTLGQVASRLPADFDTSNPLFARLERILQEIVESFQDKFEIFDSAREQLQALVAEEDQRVEQIDHTVLKRVEETENLALAKSVAQEEVKARVQTHNLPGPVLEFLIQQWLKLLLLLHAKEGGESPVWKDALESMDLLIWSVEPKSTLEERRKLATAIPGLINKLTVGLKTAEIEDDVRAQFFASLMKYHTQAISAPAQSKPDPASAGQARPNQAERAHAVRQQTAPQGASSAADSRTPEFSATITVKNPFGSGEVSVDSLDFASAKADREGTEREATAADLLDRLTMGTWVEFRKTEDQTSGRPVKLIFVSPRKTRYLFAVDRAGKEIIQCTRVEITRRFRIGEAVIMDGPPEDSLFDRIMNRVVHKLSSPGAPH